jgi:hypothetical protein
MARMPATLIMGLLDIVWARATSENGRQALGDEFFIGIVAFCREVSKPS